MAEKKGPPDAVKAEDEAQEGATTGTELESRPAPPAATEGENTASARLGQQVLYTVEEGVHYAAVITDPKHLRVPRFDADGEELPPVQALTVFPPGAAPMFVTATAGDGPGTWHEA